MTPFFVQKEVLGEKIIIWEKYGNVFIQMIFHFKKLTTLEQEKESKRKKEPKIPRLSVLNQNVFVVIKVVIE